MQSLQAHTKKKDRLQYELQIIREQAPLIYKYKCQMKLIAGRVSKLSLAAKNMHYCKNLSGKGENQKQSETF